MYALSIRQPWAKLIVLGLRPLEMRLWATRYRGPLLIHAATRIDCAAMRIFAGDGVFVRPDEIGALVGRCNLVDIVPMSRYLFNVHFYEHFEVDSFRKGLKAWRLRDPEIFSRPIPYKGRQQLFDIDEKVLAQIKIAP